MLIFQPFVSTSSLIWIVGTAILLLTLLIAFMVLVPDLPTRQRLQIDHLVRRCLLQLIENVDVSELTLTNDERRDLLEVFRKHELPLALKTVVEKEPREEILPDV